MEKLTIYKRKFAVITILAALIMSPTVISFAEEFWTDTGKYMNYVSSGEMSEISGNGRYVVFVGPKNTLKDAPNNNADVYKSIYRKDLYSGQIVRVSTDSNNNLLTNPVHEPKISDSGRFVLFQMVVTDTHSDGVSRHRVGLFRKDMENGKLVTVFLGVSKRDGGNSIPIDHVINSTGRFVAYGVERGEAGWQHAIYDYYLKDIGTGEIKIIDKNINGEKFKLPVNGGLKFNSVSSDGLFVLFGTNATNVVPDDTNNTSDIFLKNMNNGEIVRLSTNSLGHQTVNGGIVAKITPDNRFIIFVGFITGSDYIEAQGRSGFHVMRKDLQTGEVKFASANVNGELGARGDAWSQSISSDGRYVVFLSASSNLVPNDNNFGNDATQAGHWEGDCTGEDVFRKDLWTGAIARISINSSGKEVAGPNRQAHMSSSGRYISFASAASLVPGKYSGIYFADMNYYPLPYNPDPFNKLLIDYSSDKTPPALTVETPYKIKRVINKKRIFMKIKAADSASGLSKVMVSNDGLKWLKKSANALITWRVTDGDGVKKIYVKAIDRVGNVNKKTAYFKWDETSPRAKVTAPAGGSKVKGTIKITVDTRDPIVNKVSSGMRGVNFFVNGKLVLKSTNLSAVYNLNTKAYSNGSITVKIVAVDKAGNKNNMRRNYIVAN